MTGNDKQPTRLLQRVPTVKIQEVATPGPWKKYSCDFCDEVSDYVERRTYGVEIQALGRTLWFNEEGLNEYCPVCDDPVEYKVKRDAPEEIRNSVVLEKEWRDDRHDLK